MKTIFRLLAAGLGALFAAGCASPSPAFPDRAPELMSAESDAFRASIAGHAERQIEAIRQARSGNRAALDAIRKSRRNDTPPPAGIEMINTLVKNASGTLPLRIYHPAGPDATPRPVVVYLHGGGWVLGGIESASRVAGELAARSDAVVMVPEYRLAPESPCPAALDDLISVVEFARGHAAQYGGDSRKIILAGDSAGGNLALAGALRLARTGEPQAAGLVLFYPVTTLVPAKGGSYSRYGEGYALDSRLMELFSETYQPDRLRFREPELSPLYGDPGILPPLFLATAERDILRDQGAALAGKAAAAGVRVEYLDLPGATHLFITMPGMNHAFNRAVSAAAEFIRTL